MTGAPAPKFVNRTIAGFALAILLAVGGATWNLRGFITSSIDEATDETNARLETAIANIREEIRAGRESTDRQMAEIRQFIFDLYGEDENDNNENDEQRDGRNAPRN
ncbi:MAG: hypothetical protein OXG04_02315 [Acidobacteria bacterium]|nr:hypothetical protein [Acidobacteriota bacterium]